MVQGRCLCGSIQYTVNIPESELLEGGIGCHCNDCKTAGSSASHNLSIDRSKIQINEGKPKEYVGTGSSGKPVHRYFCGDCGTPVWINTEAMPEVSFLKVGPLGDFGNRVKMTTEIWCENANPSTLRPNTTHLDASSQPIDIKA